MNIPLWSIIGYLVATALIGMLATKRKGGVREFFVAGGNLSWPMLMPFLIAEFVSATATVGVAEMAYESGVMALVLYIGIFLGLIVLAFGLAKFYTSIKKITVGEVFALLFDQKNRLACVLFLLVGTVLVISTGYIGLGAILAPILNIPYATAVWLSTAILVAIAVIGGIRGVAWMNIVHTGVIIICFAIGAVVSVNAAGGLGNLFASLPAEHLNIFRPGGFTFAAWIISSVAINLIGVITVTGMLAAKNERNAKIAALSSGPFLVAIVCLPMLMGLSAYVLMPDIPHRLALWKMAEYCGVTISTLTSIGVIAAIVSSTPGSLISVGGLATRDIFLLIRPNAHERSQMIFSRLIIPVLGFAGAAFALTQPSILGLVLKLIQVRAIIGIVLLVSVVWRRLHATAAFATTIAGCVVGFIWFFAGSPFGIEPLWPGLGIGLLTLVVTSVIRKPLPFKGAEGLMLAPATSNPGGKER